jgi:predicted RecB family nuclease
MSYSFNLRAASKAAAKAAVAEKLAEATKHQACHARDQAQAQATADAFIDLLPDSPKEIAVSMSGSLIGKWAGTDVVEITGAAVSFNAYFVDPAAAS